MKQYIKDNWKFLLFVLIGGTIGGYCIGSSTYDTLSAEMLAELNKQNVTKEMVSISTMFQYGILFGLILAGAGIVTAKKVDLWKRFEFNKKAAITTAVISVVSALLLFPGDKLIFGSFNSWVNDLYTVTPTIEKILGETLVGGIIEEVMMRLFLMSLLVLIGSKVFNKDKKDIPEKIYVTANVISALLFAAGHIPATIAMTALTPVLLLRCFIFNGGLGLCFGYLYRKYNLGCAMIAHGAAHLISDILMMIFI